jgi:hypothetical protein
MMKKNKIWSKWDDPHIGKLAQGLFDVTLTLKLKVNWKALVNATVEKIILNRNTPVIDKNPDGAKIPWVIEKDGTLIITTDVEAGTHRVAVWIKDSDNDRHVFRLPFTVKAPEPDLADDFEFTTPREIEPGIYTFDIQGKMKGKEHEAKLVFRGPSEITLTDTIGNRNLGKGAEFPFDVPVSGLSVIAFTESGKIEKTLKLVNTTKLKPITFKPEVKQEIKPLARKLKLLGDVAKVGERRWEFTLKIDDEQDEMAYDGVVSFNLPYQAKVFDAHASSTPLPDPRAVEIPDGTRQLQIELPQKMVLEPDTTVTIPVSLGKTTSFPLKLEIPKAEPEKTAEAKTVEVVGTPIYHPGDNPYYEFQLLVMGEKNAAKDGHVNIGCPATATLKSEGTTLTNHELVAIPTGMQTFQLYLADDPGECIFPVILLETGDRTPVTLTKPKSKHKPATKLIIEDWYVLDHKENIYAFLVKPLDEDGKPTEDVVFVSGNKLLKAGVGKLEAAELQTIESDDIDTSFKFPVKGNNLIVQFEGRGCKIFLDLVNASETWEVDIVKPYTGE